MTPQQKINDDKDIAVLDQINAMRSYEENITIQCYFTAEVDEPCRKAMVDCECILYYCSWYGIRTIIPINNTNQLT